MLYDPKWEKPADVFSLESLTAWLEKQPEDKTYNYMNCDGECLFGQYITTCGFDWRTEVKGSRCFNNPRLEEFKRLVYYKITEPRPHAFGAALERPRKALASQP